MEKVLYVMEKNNVSVNVVGMGRSMGKFQRIEMCKRRFKVINGCDWNQHCEINVIV